MIVPSFWGGIVSQDFSPARQREGVFRCGKLPLELTRRHKVCLRIILVFALDLKKTAEFQFTCSSVHIPNNINKRT